MLFLIVLIHTYQSHSVSSMSSINTPTSPAISTPGPFITLHTDVGFSNLPNWYLQRVRKQGTFLNLLLVGAPGKGKSTLVNTIFAHTVLPSSRPRYPSKTGGMEFAKYRAEVQEAGVKVDLEVVEVLGFGEIGQSKDRQAIIEYVEQRHREHFKAREERGVRPIRAKNHLFHAALVFLSVTNHGINRSELQLIKELQRRVAVIPIISKADMLLPVEFEGLKVQVRDALKREDIIEFPSIVEIGDEEWVLREALEIKARFPLFTTAGHNSTEGEEVGKGVRSRSYPWGSVNLERDDWNDLLYAQKLLVRSFFEFLRVHAERQIHEAFRSELIAKNQQAAVQSVEDGILISPKSDTLLSLNQLNTPPDSIASPSSGLEDLRKAKKKGKSKSSKVHSQEEIVFEVPVVLEN